MKKIYQAQDPAVVGYYKSVIEEWGIPVLLKSDGLNSLMGPSHVFHPSLYVDDEHYETAMKILAECEPPKEEEADGGDWLCGECNEENPEDFGVCWNCQTPKQGMEMEAPEESSEETEGAPPVEKFVGMIWHQAQRENAAEISLQLAGELFQIKLDRKDLSPISAKLFEPVVREFLSYANTEVQSWTRAIERPVGTVEIGDAQSDWEMDSDDISTHLTIRRV